jgi:hypothetical protein
MLAAARHDVLQPDEARHTLTVREVEQLLANAGVQRSHRHVLRLCQSGMLDAVKIPGGPSGEEWYVAPASVPKAIGDLKQIDAQKARRSPTQPATSGHGAVNNAHESDRDIAGRGATEPDVSYAQNKDNKGATEPGTARHDTTALDIYEHPYVKRLEDRVEKLEAKYEAQVRRTEDIQLKSQQQIIELQRMTAIGQSQTLADFMLKAKDWLLGQGPETDKREADSQATT